MLDSQADIAAKAHAVLAILLDLYPSAHCELDYDTPFQLLVATILSAQSTDVRVNQTTKELFRKYPDALALSVAQRSDLETLIRPVGFFRMKADFLMQASQLLVQEYDGEVPSTLAELVELPGVGRKTANVVLNEVFGVPGLTVDTHFTRLSRRFGWTTQTNPNLIESEVGELFEPSEYNLVNHALIWHGRRRCYARKPACGACRVAELCPWFGEGSADPDIATTEVRPQTAS
ncbi:MAG: endonuclease III [Propionibacteriaceae bacterium]|nr:endonuclease III [Propionibacteriaceae bacterium]